jgi:hypothetical protein
VVLHTVSDALEILNTKGNDTLYLGEECEYLGILRELSKIAQRLSARGGYPGIHTTFLSKVVYLGMNILLTWLLGSSKCEYVVFIILLRDQTKLRFSNFMHYLDE